MSRREAEQLGLFPDKEVRNKEADEPWKKSETDRMLDQYLAGAQPNRIAQMLGRNPKAIKRRLEQFAYNERDRAVKYKPFRRVSRKGQRLTENEKEWIRTFKERGISPKVLAKVLARDVSEINPDTKSPARINDGKQVAPTLDLVLAYRYAYHIYKIRIISDKEYDTLKEEEIEYGAGLKALGTSRGDIPQYIKSLALYLVKKYSKKDGS